MGLLRSKPTLLWVLVVVTAHVTEAAERPKRQLKLTRDEEERKEDRKEDPRLTLGSGKTPAAGLEPGDLAAAFRVPTLDGEFTYQPDAASGPLVIHAFTNKSGFLECMWSSESSLSSLVTDLPDSTQVLFLSMDDSAVGDVLWMRDQLHRAAMQR